MTLYDLYAKAQGLIDGKGLEEYVEGYYGAMECYHEMRAEMANEVAMFGDSGPGSWLRAQEIAADLAEHKAIIDAAYALVS